MLYNLVMCGEVREIVLAFASNPAGARSHAAAYDTLRSWGIDPDAIEVVRPPACNWVAALAEARAVPAAA